MAASMSIFPLAMLAAVRSSRVLCSKRIHHRLQQVAIVSSQHQNRCKVTLATCIRVLRVGNQKCLQQNRSIVSDAAQHDNEAAEDMDIKESLTIQDKSTGYMAWKPVDDVYLRSHYPPQLKTFHEAMEMLRQQDKWMFCRRAHKYSDRTVTISVNLDMALQKKKKVDPFQSMLILPHAFKADNKVLCFASGSDMQIAVDAGADIVGNEDIVPEVLSKEVNDFDFCVSTPAMMPALVSLKRLLRKRFPNSKRGSVGTDITGMIHRYKKGQEYKCQAKAGHVNVSVGKLSLTNDQIEENIQCILTDICKHKPVEFGPFITKLTVNAFVLDGFLVDFEKYLPKPEDESDPLKENESL